MNKKKEISVEEERDLIESAERGEWRSIGNVDERRKFWRSSAERTFDEIKLENETAARNAILVAIRQRRRLSFTYKSELRIAEPYILGYDDNRRLFLLAIQRSGGRGVGYRMYTLAEMSNVEITKTKFLATAPDFNPEDPFFRQTVAELYEIVAEVA